MDINNFQRVGSVSNAHAGKDFEDLAKAYFAQNGIQLIHNFSALVGFGSLTKAHRFDLGSDAPKILVECKSHTWTRTGNTPSAKMTVWNEAMYYFHLAPESYRKILFVLKDQRREMTLARYYVKTHPHLIPPDVDIFEYDSQTNTAERLYSRQPA